jgi:hypothetical protein
LRLYRKAPGISPFVQISAQNTLGFGKTTCFEKPSGISPFVQIFAQNNFNFGVQAETGGNW